MAKPLGGRLADRRAKQVSFADRRWRNGVEPLAGETRMAKAARREALPTGEPGN
jgi:hypothetical protein